MPRVSGTLAQRGLRPLLLGHRRDRTAPPFGECLIGCPCREEAGIAHMLGFGTLRAVTDHLRLALCTRDRMQPHTNHIVTLFASVRHYLLLSTATVL